MVTNIFYFLVIIGILIEFHSLIFANRIVAGILLNRKYDKQIDDLNDQIDNFSIDHEFSEEELKKLQEQINNLKVERVKGALDNCGYIGAVVAYAIWTILGFFTFQWPIFLLLIVMGFIKARLPIKIWIVRLDAIISIALLFFIVINAYHLHIDVVSIVMNWF
jgi:hypothetical protein